MLTLILFSIIIGLILVYLWKVNQSYDYFKHRGISGPEPKFFFGHYQIFWSTKSFSQLIRQWTQKYGSIYGLFTGRTPTYVVSDVDFLEEVYIKQFSSFHSRDLPKVLQVQTDGNVHLFRSSGARWRRQRHVLNPTFSSAKLKLMSPLVKGSIEAMLNKISQSENQEINIYDLYKRLTMDVICRCAFGIDTDMQNDVNNPYLLKAGELFKVDIETVPMVKLSNLVPILARPFHAIAFTLSGLQKQIVDNVSLVGKILSELPGLWFLQRVQEVIDLRKDSQIKSRVDLLQLMMDVSTNDKIIDYADENLMSKLLHVNETLANIFLFMIAGYETTSTALAYSTYILATKPEIQQKLLEEINEKQWDNLNDSEIYDLVASLTYLDYFVREVLRMYPISVKAMTRICNTTTTVRGHTVEQG